MSDHNDKGNRNSGNIVQGISISGKSTFTADNVTVTIKDISQKIVSIPNTNDDEREQLKQLVAQLQEALTAVPAKHEADAKLLVTRTEQLVEEASQETPDKEEVEHKANKLKQAAEKLKDAMPIVLAIATQIVAQIVKSSAH